MTNRVLAALEARLRTASGLLTSPGNVPGEGSADAIELLELLLGADRVDDRTTWLAFVAASTVLPTHTQVQELAWELEFLRPRERAELLLRVGQQAMAEAGAPLARLRPVSDVPFVDVDFCATHALHTGIQRVVRNVVPRWIADGHEIQLARWSPRGGGYQDLDEVETNRVLRWDDSVRETTSAPVRDEDEQDLLVPWNTTVILPEVPTGPHCEKLTALVRHTPNRMVSIGYDCIPVVSADLVPELESEKFVHYLALIKHTQVVAAISAAAAAEFRGFVRALPVQGLTGPEVVDAGMAVEVPAGVRAGAATPLDPPQVVCVGSQDPRKNQLSVLFAAETLWREGLSFSLRLIGGRSWDDAGFARRAAALSAKGRPVTIERGVGDRELCRAYRHSWFTVFVSLHEGFGLPVGESLAMGAPVIASARPPMSEMEEGGGVLLVDPTDDGQLIDAMRRLLTDRSQRDELAEQARARSFLTWDDYAARLWATFSAPEVAEPASAPAPSEAAR